MFVCVYPFCVIVDDVRSVLLLFLLLVVLIDFFLKKGLGLLQQHNSERDIVSTSEVMDTMVEELV